MSKKNKVFMWFQFQTNTNKNSIISGPPFKGSEWEIHRHNMFHTLKELLDMPFSSILKEKLSSAKEGTIISLYDIDKNCLYYLKRVHKEIIIAINELDTMSDDLCLLRSKIRKLIPDSLKDKEKELIKEINKRKKYVDKYLLE